MRAVIDGRKTQTRRVITSENAQDADDWHFSHEHGLWESGVMGDGGPMAHGEWVRCPYGRPGERLYVKETFAKDVPGCLRGISYRADHSDPRGDGPAHPMTWRPSIFMPRWASRISLEVAAVRVERLQSISEGDAVTEGVDSISMDDVPRQATWCRRDDFAQLWNSINAKRGYGWGVNPWVWVVSFRVAEVRS